MDGADSVWTACGWHLAFNPFSALWLGLGFALGLRLCSWIGRIQARGDRRE